MFGLNKSMWLGPEEKVFNEGFETLFSVKEDYQVPPASPSIMSRLTNMLGVDKNKTMTHQEDIKSALDSVFGFSQKKNNNKETKILPQLQLVQSPTAQVNIVVAEPRSFEDSLEIVNHIKERKSVIVNLQHLDRELSQRVIDFVSGATLSLDGTQERIGHGVFIFASMNCNVQSETHGAKTYKDLFVKTFG